MSTESFEVDYDAEAVWFDGTWLGREDLARKIKGMIEGGDYRVARPSSALERLEAALANARVLAVRVSPKSPTRSTRRLAALAVPAALLREALAYYLGGGAAQAQAPVSAEEYAVQAPEVVTEAVSDGEAAVELTPKRREEPVVSTSSRQEVLVEGIHVGDQPARHEGRYHALAACLAEHLAALGVLQEHDQRLRQRLGIVGRDKATGDPVLDEVRHPSHARGHHRSLGSHRLDERHGRAFVARGECDDPGVRVTRSRSRASRGSGRSRPGRAGRESLECLASFSIADHEELAGGQRRTDQSSRPQEHLVRLDGHQPSDDRHHGSIRPDAQLGPQASARGLRPQIAIEVETERHHAESLWRAHAEGKKLLPHHLADREQTVGPSPEKPLDRQEDPGTPRREVAAEDVSMVRMHYDRHPHQPRRQAAQRPGLGRVVCTT